MAVVYVVIRACRSRGKEQQPLMGTGATSGPDGFDPETLVRLEKIYPQDDQVKKMYGSI